MTDASGNIVSINNAFTDICGYSAADVLGKSCKFLQGPLTDAATIQSIRELQQAGRDFDGEILNYRKNGQTFWNAMSVTRMFDQHGAVSHFIGIMRDITEQKKTQQRLQLAANVFTFASEGIMITRPDGTIVEVNAAFTAITGYSQEEVAGRHPEMLGPLQRDDVLVLAMQAQLEAQGHWQGEIWNRHKTGESYAATLNISAVRNDNNEVDYFVALYTDITSKKNQEQQLVRSAHYDALTGLANRVLLAQRLSEAIAHAAHSQKMLALVYLDLDGFKSVNDTYGHEAGDMLLISVAQRMQAVLREGDTLARIGGDEFVAVLVDLTAPEDSLPVMQRMLHAASQAVPVHGLQVQVSASVGATYFPQLGRTDTTAEQLIKQADQTMYHAKQSGKNRIHVFDVAQNQPVST